MKLNLLRIAIFVFIVAHSIYVLDENIYKYISPNEKFYLIAKMTIFYAVGLFIAELIIKKFNKKK